MKTRAVVVFAALLLLATLAAESDAFSGNIPGKRELEEKVRQH